MSFVRRSFPMICLLLLLAGCISASRPGSPHSQVLVAQKSGPVPNAIPLAPQDLASPPALLKLRELLSKPNTGVASVEVTEEEREVILGFLEERWRQRHPSGQYVFPIVVSYQGAYLAIATAAT